MHGILLFQTGEENPESGIVTSDALRVTPDAETETCFRQSLTLARRQEAKSFELRAVMGLSRLWQHQGKRQAAYQLLVEVYGGFTEGFDTADLREAKALLDRLGT